MPRRPRWAVEVQICSFFNLGATWGWVVKATRRLFYPRKETRYSMQRRLGGTQDRSGRGAKNLAPNGFRSPDRTAVPNSWGFEITLRYTTFGWTPLQKRSADRSDLYLTTHNTHKRQTTMPPTGVELATSACERQQIPRHILRGHWNGSVQHVPSPIMIYFLYIERFDWNGLKAHDIFRREKYFSTD
jgi:hypothetical protein